MRQPHKSLSLMVKSPAKPRKCLSFMVFSMFFLPPVAKRAPLSRPAAAAAAPGPDSPVPTAALREAAAASPNAGRSWWHLPTLQPRSGVHNRTKNTYGF